jgi:Icc-related predicted phosphoesterase
MFHNRVPMERDTPSLEPVRYNAKNNVQHSKVNNKHSVLFCIFEHSNVTYVNIFKALPNATYSHSVHLC